MKKWAVVIALVTMALLTSCSASMKMPDYVVFLSQLTAKSGWCTGFAIDDRHVVSAAHCKHLRRVVTQVGYSTSTRIVQTWPAYDTVLLETADPIYLKNYAVFGKPVSYLSAQLWGHCPMYFPQGFRFQSYAVRRIRTKIPLVSDIWYGKKPSCVGDSGGPLVQNGYVVGMLWGLSKMDYQDAEFAMSRWAYVVPGELIQALLNNQ